MQIIFESMLMLLILYPKLSKLVGACQNYSSPNLAHFFRHSGWRVAEWLARSTRFRKDTGSNPARAGHYVTTVGKLFTPTVPSRAEGRLNQLAPGTAVPL